MNQINGKLLNYAARNEVGMFLCCELGRAVALWKPQSK